MKFGKLIAASLLALASVPAMAQSGITAGATVYDPQGGEVGTVKEATDSYVVVDTGTNTATLPPSAFAVSDKGPVMGMTKAQLNAAVEKAAAEAEAKLTAAMVPGAPVYGIQGEQVGTVKAINPDGTVVVHHEIGDLPFPHNQFTTIDKGLAFKFTKEQLDQALAPQREMRAKVKAALVAGTDLVTSDGLPGGKIREIDESGNAVIDYDTKAFALPADQFSIDGQGRLALIMNEAQLKAALGL